MKSIKSYKPLILIIGIFIAICCVVINRAVWFDESYSAQTIKGTFSEIAETTAADVHPPLYYYLLKIWAIPFGRSIPSLRSFSVFCGVIAIIFAYLTFKRWSKSEKTASFLTLAFAVSPLFIYYSTEIRMYGLVTAIVSASVYFLERALEEKKTRKYWVIYAFLLAAALYTHYFAALAFFAEYIYVFFCHRKDHPNLIRNLLLVSVLAAILYIPWIPSLISQVTAVEQDYWIDPVSAKTFFEFFSAGLVRFEDIKEGGPSLIITIVALVALIPSIPFLFKTMGKNTKDKTILIGCITFIPFLTLFILSTPPLSPLYVPRYLTYSFAYLWVLIAIFIVQAYGVKPLLAKFLLLLMAICLTCGIANVFKENEYVATVEGVMTHIETFDADSSTPVVFDEVSSNVFDAVFYQTEKHHVYVIDSMESWYAARPLVKYGDNYINDFEEFKKENDVFWYVVPSYSATPALKHQFERNGFKVDHMKYVDGYMVYKCEKEKDLKTTENLL